MWSAVILAVFLDQILLIDSLSFPLSYRLSRNNFFRCGLVCDIDCAIHLLVMYYGKLAILTEDLSSLVQEPVLFEVTDACIFFILSLLHLVLTVVPCVPPLHFTESAVIDDRLSALWYVDGPAMAKWTGHARFWWYMLFLITVVLEELPRLCFLGSLRSSLLLLLR